MLHLTHALVSHLQGTVPGFATVAPASVIAPLKDLRELLPLCVVSPGGGEVAATAQGQLTALEDQEWDILVIVGYGHSDHEKGMTEVDASILMDKVYRSLHNQKLEGMGGRSGFAYLGRGEPVYNLGWAVFPLLFTARIVIASDAFNKTNP